MTRDEILSLAWETAGNPQRWTEEDVVDFAEAVVRRAVEEYLDKVAEEFEASVQEMLHLGKNA